MIISWSIDRFFSGSLANHANITVLNVKGNADIFLLIFQSLLLEYYQSGLGFDVTRVDSSQTAISIAEKNAREKGGRCRIIVADLPVDRQEVTGTFDFAFDWELLHHIFPKDHQTYIRNVHRILNPRCHIPLRLLLRTGPAVCREREIPEDPDRDYPLLLIGVRAAGTRLPAVQDPGIKNY